MGGSPFDPILSVTHGLEMNLLSLRLLPLRFGYSDESFFSFRPSPSRVRIAIYLSIYVTKMWFQGSVDCPSPAARGGETNDVPAWAPISQLFPLFRSETLKWSVDSTFCSSHRPSLSDRLDGSTPEKG